MRGYLNREQNMKKRIREEKKMELETEKLRKEMMRVPKKSCSYCKKKVEFYTECEECNTIYCKECWEANVYERVIESGKYAGLVDQIAGCCLKCLDGSYRLMSKELEQRGVDAAMERDIQEYHPRGKYWDQM